MARITSLAGRTVMMSVNRRNKLIEDVIASSNRRLCEMVGHDYKWEPLEAWRTLGQQLFSRVYRCSRCKRRITK